ncbi:MAG: hypothetical protein ACFFCD_07960 [Promethearchaeota archaeon]
MISRKSEHRSPIIFCGIHEPKVPPYVAKEVGSIAYKCGYYDLKTDAIYIFLSNPCNHSPRDLVDTIIHESIERAICRVFWDNYVKATSFSHLFIKISIESDKMLSHSGLQ